MRPTGPLLPLGPLLPVGSQFPAGRLFPGDGSVGTVRPVDGGQGRAVPVVLRGSVGAADGPVTTPDTDDLLRRVTGHCAGLVLGGAAGIVLVDDADQPRLAAVTATGTATGQQAADLLGVLAGATPGTVAARTGRTVTVGDLTAGEPDTVPFGTADWCRRAHAVGYRSAHAVPLRLCARVIGALTIRAPSRTAPGSGPRRGQVIR